MSIYARVIALRGTAAELTDQLDGLRFSSVNPGGFESASFSVPCGPCSQRVCPLKHHECMRHLSVHRVYAAALEQLVIQRESRAQG